MNCNLGFRRSQQSFNLSRGGVLVAVVKDGSRVSKRLKVAQDAGGAKCRWERSAGGKGRTTQFLQVGILLVWLELDLLFFFLFFLTY